MNHAKRYPGIPKRPYPQKNAKVVLANLGCGRALFLPGTHSIRYPFKEVGSAYNCLYFGSPHIVADRIAHTDKGNGNARILQCLDET